MARDVSAPMPTPTPVPANLREKMGDLQVVCEGRSDQLEADLSEENLEEYLLEDLFHRDLSFEGAEDELDRIILPLRPNRDLSQTGEDDLALSPEIRDGDVSRLPLPGRPMRKRPSDGDFGEQKRSKMSETNDASYDNLELN